MQNKIRAVCHMLIGERAFHVVVSEETEKEILKLLIKGENAFQDNDDKNWYKLDHIMNVYKEEFND